MATKVLVLATVQVAGLTTTQIAGLNCVQISAGMTVADFAALANAIVDDQQIIKLAKGPNGATIQPGVIFTATTTNASAAMTSFLLVSPSTAAVGSIEPGMHVSGPGLALGSRVLTAVGTTITLDRAAVGAVTTGVFCATGANLSGEANQSGWILTVPNRGLLQMWTGDVLAVDTLGFPYLIPANSVNFNGGGANSGAPFKLV